MFPVKFAKILGTPSYRAPPVAASADVPRISSVDRLLK